MSRSLFPFRAGALFAAFAFALVTVLTGAPAVAQEGTPSPPEAQSTGAAHPAHIHSGTCAQLGEVVAPLADVVFPPGMGIPFVDQGTPADATSDAEARGDEQPMNVGQSEPTPVAVSFTTVPLSLPDILAADHAINVHLSAEEIGTYIACGTIGGDYLIDGAISIGLGQMNNSGYSGVAYLIPNAVDAANTDVTIFLTYGLAGSQGVGTDIGAAEESSPAGVDDVLEAATPVAGSSEVEASPTP